MTIPTTKEELAEAFSKARTLLARASGMSRGVAEHHKLQDCPYTREMLLDMGREIDQFLWPERFQESVDAK